MMTKATQQTSAETTTIHSKPFNALFVCFGGMSNTGYATGLAAMKVVDEVGAGRARIMCLAGLPAGVPSVAAAIEAAENVIAVDGCQNRCALKMLQAAGLMPDHSITLTEEAEMHKVSFATAEPGAGPSTLIDEEDVNRAAELIRSLLV